MPTPVGVRDIARKEEPLPQSGLAEEMVWPAWTLAALQLPPWVFLGLPSLGYATCRHDTRKTGKAEHSLLVGRRGGGQRNSAQALNPVGEE